MIKAIIFDIGGVITDTDFDAIYSNLAKKIGAPEDEIIALHNKRTEGMLLGSISFKDFLSEIKKQATYFEGDIQQIWLEEALKQVKLNKELLDFIDDLRKNYTLAVLSSVSESRSIIDEKLDIYSHFDFTFLSFKEHLVKPDERFYNLALKTIGIKPSEAIFIDDAEIHTFAAEALGIKSVIFKNNAQLKSELTQKLDNILKNP